MKKQVLKISVIGLFLAGGFAGCGSDSGNGNAGQQEEKHQHEDHDHENMKNSDGKKSAYICPMKCEGSASEEAGQCPECGMDLVKRSELDEK